MGLAVLVSLIVVFANAALVARYVLRWDRRGLPADSVAPQPETRAGAVRT